MAGTLTMGTTLTIKGENSDSDKILARIVSIGEMGGEHEETDSSSLDSPNGAKESIPTGTDYGTCDITGNVITGEQTKELYDNIFKARVNKKWEVRTPRGATQTFNAFIKAFKFGEKTVDGLDTFTMTLRLTSDIDYKKGA